MTEKNSRDEMNELFSALDSMLGGTESQEQPPAVEPEPQEHLQEGPGHEGVAFDCTDAFANHVLHNMEEIEKICNRVGIPFQACFELRADKTGATRRHFVNGTIATIETQAGFMIYHLPHAISHMVLMLCSVSPGTFPSSQQPMQAFNHLKTFDEEVFALVAAVSTSCQLLNIPYQLGFVPKVEAGGYETRAVCSPFPHLTSCEMKAAFVMYQAAGAIKLEVIDTYNDFFAPDDDDGEVNF